MTYNEAAKSFLLTWPTAESTRRWRYKRVPKKGDNPCHLLLLNPKSCGSTKEEKALERRKGSKRLLKEAYDISFIGGRPLRQKRKAAAGGFPRRNTEERRTDH